MATKYYFAGRDLKTEVDVTEYEGEREIVTLIPEVPEIKNLEPIDKDAEREPSANVYAGLIGNAPYEIGTRVAPAEGKVGCPFLVIEKEDDSSEDEGGDEGDEGDDSSEDDPVDNG